MTSDGVPDAPNEWHAQSTVIHTALIGLWHAERAPGASDRANEVGPVWIRLPAVAGSGAGLVGRTRLRLGVGHASTVRPDPSTLGVVGERGSHHEGRSPARSR